MRQTLQDKISAAKNLLDVLLILKETTMRDTHVATLAYVRGIVKQKGDDSYGILECSPFPLNEDQDDYLIQAYYFQELNLATNQTVLVVFTDLNFINNLNAVDFQPKPTYDLIYHSIKYGVVIPVSTGGELTEEEREEILDF